VHDDHDDLTLGHYIAILIAMCIIALAAIQTGRVPYQFWP